MKYKEWIKWVRSKPWLLRWFVYLVLFRPIIDNLYYLKYISPFLSPLYIVGVLTPILALTAIVRYRGHFSTTFDTLFRTWSVIVIITTLAILISGGFDLLTLSSALKFAMPVFVFFFLRVFMQSKKDLDGLIQTFLYSLGMVMILFFYELIIGPIRITESRGLSRIQGNFGDVFNYGLYLCFGLIFLAYREMQKNRQGIRPGVIFRLSLLLGIGVLVLLRINHAASLLVFTFILFLFAWYQSRKNLIAVFVFVVAGIVIFQVFGDQLMEESISPLFEKDLMALSGEVNEEQLFHGRYGRWQYYWEFYQEQSLPAQLLSVPLFNPGAPLYLSTGSGSHNDYIRIGLFSGILGLFIYLLFHLRLWRKTRKIPLHDRFLISGVLVLLGLYSITLTPTVYAPLLYMAYATFAYIIRTYMTSTRRR